MSTDTKTTDPIDSAPDVVDPPAPDAPAPVEPERTDAPELVDGPDEFEGPYAVDRFGNRLDGPPIGIDQGVRPFVPAPSIDDRIAAAERAGDWVASRRMKAALTFDPAWRRLHTP